MPENPVSAAEEYVNMKKKLLTSLICMIFLLNPLIAAGSTGIYDFSDEAQEEFNRANGVYTPNAQVQFQIPTEKPKKNNKVKTKKPKKTKNTVQKTEPKENVFKPLEPEPEMTLQSGIVFVEAGSLIEAQLNSDISSATLENNDLISAQLTSDWVCNGVLIAPEGSIINGSITDAKSAGLAMKNGEITIDFRELYTPDGRTIPLSANKVLIKVDTNRAWNLTKSVLGGAIVGTGIAALMLVLTGDPSALWQGAIAGGSLGALAGVSASGEEVELPQGTPIQLQLSAPMQVEAYPL